MAVVRTLRLMSVLNIRQPGRRQRVSLNTFGSSLGLKVSRTDQLIDQVQHGLSFKALISFEATSGMTASELALNSQQRLELGAHFVDNLARHGCDSLAPPFSPIGTLDMIR
jgi:hypothetical protein